MDKTTLHKIFSKTFDDASWLEVLKSVFGAKLGLLAQPRPILLKSNDKASAAFELGSFTTTDDRIIGLYKIEIKPEVWLERNKVGLRELLRNVYQYDVDGAIIVFTQQDKWRLSFVSEIKILNDEGEIVEQVTEPKRYTYLLGVDEKVRTPSDRLSKLSGKSLALQDILNAFSVEALNEEFYKIIQAYFYELVGGKIGKGNKVKDYKEGILQLPSVPKEHRQIYQEFAVRLIGRTVFCWFLKMKKSNEDAPLLPENLLSSRAVMQNSGYYHNILERLFFQTLNTPMDHRVDNLPEGAEQIPFLNGGLFEPGNQDYYRPSKVNGLNENLNTLKIEDDWFEHFFKELEKYNFTIDENSVTDVEVSVDPEMLGRIFENLLAEIDPDSGETARKATGSFYTPREIVDYMATESLVQYIHNKTDLPQDKLRPIFKMMDKHVLDFTKAETESILDALDKVKILDPACGSGAFPMGVLQKIVQALQKLDPDAEWWKKRQVDRVSNAIVRKQLKEKLESSGVEYARKIGVIQNSLYGVDIQPVAAEISKLRCFLSLVVDENIDESKSNRGIEPLPNLEFKFVTADTLIQLPETNGKAELNKKNKKSSAELELDLNKVRQEYIQSFGKEKLSLKLKFKEIQKEIFDQQGLFGVLESDRYYKISTWNPFNHEKADWFDPKWMFGVEKFDVVIGNPPYGGSISTSLKKASYYSETSFGGKESYKFFFNRCLKLFSNNQPGIICFITSDSFIEKENFEDLRLFLLKKTSNIKLLALGDNVFNNVNIPTSISILKIDEIEVKSNVQYMNLSNFISNNNKVDQAILGKFVSVNPMSDPKKRFVKVNSFRFNIETKPLIELYDQVMGVKVYQIGKGKPLQSNYEIENDIFVSEELKQKGSWMRFIDSGVKRYHYDGSIKYINYGKWLAEPRNPKYFLNPKIIMREVVNPTPFSFYFEDSAVVKNTNAVIIEKYEGYPLLFLLPILNSKMFARYVIIESPKSSNKSFPSITSKLLKSFPIPVCSLKTKESFTKIATYINSLFSFKTIINPHVPNSHIAQFFEEVIDAMVMELYFKEDFEKAGIEFIKYVARDFESIENKSEPEQIEIIHRAYQKLREKDNEIRNNLKLMDIKLADIVMPIKAAK